MKQQTAIELRPLLQQRSSAPRSNGTDITHLFPGLPSLNWNLVFYNINLYAEDFTWIVRKNHNDQKTLLHFACECANEQEAYGNIKLLFESMAEHYPSGRAVQQFVNDRNSENKTALQIAIEMHHKSLIFFLITKGADVNELDFHKKRDALSVICELHPTVMTKLFDESLVIQKDDFYSSCEKLWTLECNFLSLVGKDIQSSSSQSFEQKVKSFQQMKLLGEILRQNRNERSILLTHPLVQIFLFLKSKRFKWFIFLSILCHIVWSLLAATYLYCQSSTEPNDANVYTNVSNPDNDSQKKKYLWCSWMRYDINSSIHVQGLFFMLVLIYITAIIKEFYEFKASPSWKFYCMQIENCGQWAVILIIAVVTITDFLKTDIYLVNVVGITIALLLIQIQFTKIDILGIYNQMMIMGSYKFLFFFVAFFPMLLSFMVLFYQLTLNDNRPEFHFSGGLGLIKIISMMTGELNYNEIVEAQTEGKLTHPASTKGALFLFAVLVTILLQNLLIGLTVSNIEKLKRHALQRCLAEQLEVIYQVEKFLTNRLVSRALDKIFPDWLEKFLTKCAPVCKGITTDIPFIASTDRRFRIELKKLPKKLQKFIAKAALENPELFQQSSSN